MYEFDVAEVVHQLGGIARTADLVPLFDQVEVDAAVERGDVRRIGRGRYALAGVEEALVAATSVSGVISGLSAARWWGWAVKTEPERPVVTVPRNRSRTRTDIDVRRQDLLPASVVERTVTTRAQTVVDCARTLPFDEALAVADSALRDGRVTRAELVTAAEAAPRTGRSAALRVARAADARADNPFESVVRAIALDVPGLEVTPQGRVADVGWADLVDERRRLAIECDSWAFHASREAFRRDVRRYTAMVCAGWTVLRFCWEDAMEHPDRVRESLVAAVGQT